MTFLFYFFFIQNEKSKQFEYAFKDSQQRSSVWMLDLRAKICAKDQFNQSPESSQHDKNSLVQRMRKKVSDFSGIHSLKILLKFCDCLRTPPKKPSQKHLYTYLESQNESIY